MNLFRQTKHFKQFFIIENDIYIRETTITIDFRGEHFEESKIKWKLIKSGKAKNISKKLNDQFENDFNESIKEHDQQINN
jgi:hypothetical protein